VCWLNCNRGHFASKLNCIPKLHTLCWWKLPEMAFLAPVGFLKMTAFWNAVKNGKSLGFWNHLELPLWQMSQYKVN
jgi:hypothetical protein